MANRIASRNRQQLVCFMADNSGSMKGKKAAKATAALQEAIVHCQLSAMQSEHASYHRFCVIMFDDLATVHKSANNAPVRDIDPEQMIVAGDGGRTNITDALQAALEVLEANVKYIREHKERSLHPLPLTILFSDGQHNSGNVQPQAVAERIKALNIDGESLPLIVFGIDVPSDEQIAGEDHGLEPNVLRAIASPGGYFCIRDINLMPDMLAAVASSQASSVEQVRSALGHMGSSE